MRMEGGRNIRPRRRQHGVTPASCAWRAARRPRRPGRAPRRRSARPAAAPAPPARPCASMRLCTTIARSSSRRFSAASSRSPARRPRSRRSAAAARPLSAAAAASFSPQQRRRARPRPSRGERGVLRRQHRIEPRPPRRACRHRSALLHAQHLLHDRAGEAQAAMRRDLLGHRVHHHRLPCRLAFAAAERPFATCRPYRTSAAATGRAPSPRSPARPAGLRATCCGRQARSRRGIAGWRPSAHLAGRPAARRRP